MDKDTINSVALIGLLLLIIIVAYYMRQTQALVVTRPDLATVIGQVLGQKTPSPTPEPTPKPSTSAKEAWARDPVPKVATEIAAKYALDLSAQGGRVATYINEQLWWRSDEESYRILVPGAKTVGVQVLTTETAGQLAPNKPGEDHPALKHPLLAKIIKQISNQLGDLGYKRSQFKTCPISEAYDPFNNCLYFYTKDAQKCSLIAGYGRLDKQTDVKVYLRLELTCSDNYQTAYEMARPFLFTVNIVSPEWLVPDMAVYSVQTLGNWSRVSFGSQYGIFEHLTNGYRLVGGGSGLLSCETVQQNRLPQEIYQNCL